MTDRIERAALGCTAAIYSRDVEGALAKACEGLAPYEIAAAIKRAIELAHAEAGRRNAHADLLRAFGRRHGVGSQMSTRSAEP